MVKPAAFTFESALTGADVFVAKFHQLLRGHTALRTLRVAAVYDDLHIPGQIRGPYLSANPIQRGINGEKLLRLLSRSIEKLDQRSQPLLAQGP
jgi:hypothetical protein